MKLLFVIKRLAGLAGGAERVLCLLASELVQRGHEVSLLTFDAPDNAPFYPLHPGVIRVDLDIGDSALPARFRETVSRIAALRCAITTLRPDVAIGFNLSTFILLGPALAGTGIPVVGSDHIVPDHFKGRPVQALLYRFAAPFLTRITVLSDEIRARYPKAIRNRMVAITNPVEPLSGSMADGLAGGQNVILNVGRLDPGKDQATLLSAFAQLAPAFPSWRLRILGDGALRPELEALARRLSITDRVDMPGVTQAIHAAYREADIFALSSAYESFGLVTIEAMQHGLAVLGFADCPGTNEVIDDQVTGLLVMPESRSVAGQATRVAAFAAGLARLMRDPVLRRRLGTAAQKAVAGQFSLSDVTDRWEALLSDAAASR